MCDISKIIIVLHLFIVFMSVLLIESYEQIDEGEPCQQLGLAGICQKVIECPAALDALAYMGQHYFKVCGYDGPDQIVCCPNEDVEIHVGKPQLPIWGPISEVTTRASDKACEKNYDDYNIRVRFGPLIYRGVRADEGQFPHMAALGFENSYEEIEWRCGASLISLRYLVTAAHCFICNGCSDPKIARLGVIDINENNLAQDISVDRVIVHPGYNMTTKHNDIALIKLKTDVKPTEWVYPACLYSKANDPVPLQIVGWGITAPGDRNSISQNLQYGFIVPIDIEQCNKTVRKADESSSKTILKTQICGTTTTDACQGDSGGPLQTSTPEGGYEVVGIISYGSQCGSKLPGVYTRVSEYLDWIESIVWPNYLS